MHDEHPHPLLAQVPLTVSPFLSLPTATPLPYTYKQLPSTLPPSVLSTSSTTNQSSSSADPNNASQQQQPMDQQQQQQQQPAYIHSASGTSAHPDQILTSCLALQSHLQSLEASAKATLQQFEDRRKAAELAEKRRVAPGWLDGDVKLLRPENIGGGSGDAEMGGVDDASMQGQGHGYGQRRMSVGIKGLVEKRDGVPDAREGEALDRAFGGLDIK
ncbi:hypothetical protein DM02DRAFT_586272 [Periconia macrospinosa]|uniref:Uncharacterized protein n=1 Tax=Periconia macrospinosa TaxID=97972 RepID=A0A2V1E3T4_9PLEO|nr:hypothetical protein DM02DRAFT_586272 [Periconia macrospinosa]